MSPVEFDATPDLLETVLTCRRGANVSCRVVPVLTCRAWACDGSKEVCVGLASVCPAVDIGCALAAAGGLTRLALGRPRWQNSRVTRWSLLRWSLLLALY